MKFHQPEADVFVPDGSLVENSLKRVTHLGIGAHADDLEFMAFEGILAGYRQSDSGFCGVVCTDGRGSSRTGTYARMSDDELRIVRRSEQRAAATEGRYSAMIQLDYPSNDLGAGLMQDLQELLEYARPHVVYTHNPADKHPTHVSICLATLQALRSLPPDKRPARVVGCEVWRGLDWMGDSEKILLDESGGEALAERLNAMFASQIAGGKRYDLAVLGRKKANATFLDPRSSDVFTSVAYAMDLSPLVQDPLLNIEDYVCAHIERFKSDVVKNLRSWK